MNLSESFDAGFFRPNFKNRLVRRLRNGILTLTLLIAIAGGASNTRAQETDSIAVINQVDNKIKSLVEAAKDYTKHGKKKEALETLNILIKAAIQLKDESLLRAATRMKEDLSNIGKMKNVLLTANAKIVSKEGKNYYQVEVICNDKLSGEAKAME